MKVTPSPGLESNAQDPPPALPPPPSYPIPNPNLILNPNPDPGPNPTTKIASPGIGIPTAPCRTPPPVLTGFVPHVPPFAFVSAHPGSGKEKAYLGMGGQLQLALRSRMARRPARRAGSPSLPQQVHGGLGPTGLLQTGSAPALNWNLAQCRVHQKM